MTPLQRAGLVAYFRRYALLVEASRFLASRAEVRGAYRFLLWTVNRALLARFYRATRLSPAAAVDRVRVARAILRARCICASPGERDLAGSCYYLDEAAEAYRRHGPLPVGLVTAEEVLADFERHAQSSDAWWMTVVGSSPCAAFPRDYVLCCCREKHCLVSSYARRFPWLQVMDPDSAEGASPKVARIVLDHLVALGIGLPSLAWWLGAYAATRARVATRCWIHLTVLLALAGVGGAIIAQPHMWRYLHWPDWQYNRFFAVLLPVAALMEVAVLAGVGEAGRRLLRRDGGIAVVVLGVLVSMVPFQLVHVLRFLSVSALTGVVPEAVARILFWAWDPVAYCVLLCMLARSPWLGTARNGSFPTDSSCSRARGLPTR